MYFNPFTKIQDIADIEKLQYVDLEILKTVDECYSVEYKSKFDDAVKNIKLPKSVCAFSNSNGGWIIIGANNDGTLCDVELSNITKESVYSAVESRVAPIPSFAVSIIYNPNKQNFGVIVIYVEEGKHTPYISNGTAYVRNGNESKPTERSTLDILIKKGLDYSDLSLKCVECGEGRFAFSKRAYRHDVAKDSVCLSFYSFANLCNRIGLYIQNNGSHYDENVELTLKISPVHLFDIRRHLTINPNLEFEGIFNSFVELRSTPEITEYLSPRSFNTPIRPNPLSFGQHNLQYIKEYMRYMYDCQYGNFEIIRDKQHVYLKIIFKEINPQQKMFLPAMLLVTNAIDKIEYSITSKFSNKKIIGTLNKE